MYKDKYVCVYCYVTKNKNKLNYKNMPTTFIVEEQTDSIDNQQEDSHSIEDNNFITTESESNTTNVEKEEQPITDIDLSKGEEIIHELHILINKKETNNIEVTLISNPESKLQYKIEPENSLSIPSHSRLITIV